jgi:Cu(I)/Ag(I) efflux system periplasmic protein CusF
MGKFRIGLAVFATLLSACDSEVPPAASEPAATEKAVEASGTGVVTAVDAAGGTITVEHGEMPELKWPPMTMAFAAPPALLSGVSPGDEVSFELSVEDGRGRITALAKR